MTSIRYGRCIGEGKPYKAFYLHSLVVQATDLQKGAWARRKAEVEVEARVVRRGRRRRTSRSRARNRLAGCLCSRTPEKSQFKAQRGRQRWRWGDLQAWVIEYELLRLGSFLITDWLTRFGGCLGPSDASNYTYDVDDADDINPDMTLHNI